MLLGCFSEYFLGQVDWAALAQAWIAQKESTGAEQQPPIQPTIQPPVQPPIQPPIQPNGQDIPGLEPVGQTNHTNFQGEPSFGRMWQPGICLTLKTVVNC